MLKVKVLADNNTLIDRYYTGEPGLSLLLEADGKKMLFDCGYSGVFIDNAQRMGDDLAEIERVIISHGHNDHTWGLTHLIQHFDTRKITLKPRFTAHPLIFESKRCEGLNIGMMLSQESVAAHFTVELSSQPLLLAENLFWLGEIPRITEPKRAVGKRLVNGAEEDDYCFDDSALAYKTTNGLVIITGCSHSGICNIVDYARKLCGCETIVDIIGGFHMQKLSREMLSSTVSWFAANPPLTMHPCHCTDLAAKIALASALNVKEAGVGLELKFS